MLFSPPQPRQQRGSPERGRPRRGAAGEDAGRAEERRAGSAGPAPRHLTGHTGPRACAAPRRAGPGKRASSTLHPGLVRMMSSGGARLASAAARGDPSEGDWRCATGLRVLVVIRIMGFSCLASIMYLHIAVILSVFWVAVLPLVILQDLPSNVYIIPATRTVNPKDKFSVRAVRKGCVILSRALAFSRSYVLYKASLLEEKLRSGLAHQQQLLCGSLFASRCR